MRIAVTGANGFVGRHVVARLAGRHEVRALISERPGAESELPPGSFDVRRADVRKPETLRGQFDDIDAVVHTVAVPTERAQRFAEVNVAGVAHVVDEARRAGVRRIVHMSALGADPRSPFPYLRSKGEGQAIVAALEHAEISGAYEVGGPQAVTYDQMLAETMRGAGTRRPTLHVPVLLMKPPAVVMGLFMKDPPVTVDQLDLLKADNTPRSNAMEPVFGVHPRQFQGALGYLRSP